MGSIPYSYIPGLQLHIAIRYTYYIPGLHCTLLSVAHLQYLGYNGLCYQAHRLHTSASLHIAIRYTCYIPGLQLLTAIRYTCYIPQLLCTCFLVHFLHTYLLSGYYVGTNHLDSAAADHQRLAHQLFTRGWLVTPFYHLICPFLSRSALRFRPFLQLVLLLLNPLSFSFSYLYQFVSTSICIPCSRATARLFCTIHATIRGWVQFEPGWFNQVLLFLRRAIILVKHAIKLGFLRPPFLQV